MMHFLSDYGMFLLKTITFVMAILIAFAGLIALGGKNGSGKHKGKLIVKKCQDDYQDLSDTLQAKALSKKAYKQHCKKQKQAKRANKQQAKGSDKACLTKAPKKRIFIIDFHGDLRASAVNCLREEINAIIQVATIHDEVLVRLESPGGMVPHYGLAASQLQRLRDNNIPLTIAVDKVAASGGYMMAAVGQRILAAPFAIIGSIGVLAQIPNFHRLLNKHHIDFEQISAGQYKRTLSVFGKNTPEGREKLQAELTQIHALFKQHIKTHRPQLDIDKVATGEYWCGEKALGLLLVDAIQTSDDYLMSHKETCDLLHVQYQLKKSLGKRLSQTANIFVKGCLDHLHGQNGIYS